MVSVHFKIDMYNTGKTQAGDTPEKREWYTFQNKHSFSKSSKINVSVLNKEN